MNCQDIMKSDVTCISPQTTVEDAARLMLEHDVGFLPVCDESDNVLGTLTDRDITIRVVAVRESPTQPVSSFMTTRVVTCRATDSLDYAEELMSQEKVSRIMCANERGQLEGVISLSDIAQVEEGARASSILRNVSEREARV
jgi:CBS domain-containing protein